MDSGFKEIDLALQFMKENWENNIPQNSFSNATLAELEEFNLVERLPNGKYRITEKGSYAKQLGACRYIEMKKSENYFADFSTEKYKANKRYINILFLVSLGLILFLIITMKDDLFI